MIISGGDVAMIPLKDDKHVEELTGAMSEETTNTKSVAVIDDHPIVRIGVRLMLEAEDELTCVGEAGSVPEAVDLVEKETPDIIVLDLWMGGNDGLELVRNLRAIAPDMKILVYSMNEELVYGPRVLRAGAAGYVMKDSGLPELSKALRSICDGERYVSSRLSQSLVAESLGSRPSSENQQVAGLTDRELQILRLLGSGRSTGDIAERLNISPKTVGAHRENLKGKLGVDSASELAQRA
ncbi:MAG: response regulator, partial [Verrucomicrobiales bacterium]